MQVSPLMICQSTGVYPLEGPGIADRWVGSRSWPTQSSVWFESLRHLHHRLHHMKELAFLPLHWPPTHQINKNTTSEMTVLQMWKVASSLSHAQYTDSKMMQNRKYVQQSSKFK